MKQRPRSRATIAEDGRHAGVPIGAAAAALCRRRDNWPNPPDLPAEQILAQLLALDLVRAAA